MVNFTKIDKVFKNLPRLTATEIHPVSTSTQSIFKLRRQLSCKPLSIKTKPKQNNKPAFPFGSLFTYFSSTSVSGGNSVLDRNREGTGQFLNPNQLHKAVGPAGCRPGRAGPAGMCRAGLGPARSRRCSLTLESSVPISGMRLFLKILFVCLELPFRNHLQTF